jgi:hypothetical protein
MLSIFLVRSFSLGLFSKTEKSKMPIDLLEDQLKFWRGRVSSITTQHDAVKRITEIENHLMALNKEQIPERIKALESAFQELLMMGREGK